MLQVYTSQNKISNISSKRKRNSFYSDKSLYYRTDTKAKAQTYIESLTKLEAEILSYLFSFRDKPFIKVRNKVIANKANCSEITVKRATAKFKRDGWVDKQQANHVYNVNDFRLMVSLKLLFYVQMISIKQSINAKRKPKTAQKVFGCGTIYDSAVDASKVIGINPVNIRRRCRLENYQDWYYVN